jgi:hypothetical protein
MITRSSAGRTRLAARRAHVGKVELDAESAETFTPWSAGGYSDGDRTEDHPVHLARARGRRRKGRRAWRCQPDLPFHRKTASDFCRGSTAIVAAVISRPVPSPGRTRASPCSLDADRADPRRSPRDAAGRGRLPRHWPEVERINLLDDALSVDRDRAGALTAELSARISALANYAISAGASGILYTCSAFGEAIEAVKQRVRMPVLKPNEAMFAEAMARGSRLGLLATFPASINSMARELAAAAPRIELESACVPQALTALQAGDGAQHDALLAAVAPKLGTVTPDAGAVLHRPARRRRRPGGEVPGAREPRQRGAR